MRVLNHTGHNINIVGIGNHELRGLDVVTAACLLDTNQGKVIGIFNEHAFLGKGNSIHSSGQMEYFKTRVDVKSIKVGGKQRLETLEGYAMPIIFKDGLAYIKTLDRPNNQELETYPHVFFTSPDTWEPSLLDHEFSPEDEITWSQLQDTRPFYDPLFDAQGDLNQSIIATLNTFLDLPDHNDTSIFNINSTSWHSLPHHSLASDVDWAALQPYYGWVPISSIQNTFKVTTRYYPAASTQDYLKKHFKARNPVFNIPRENEAVATDTVFHDTSAIADGSTMAQFSVAETPWSVMHMASRAPSNSSTPWLIISGIGEPCTPLSVIKVPMKSPRRSLTSSDHSFLLITSLKPFISNKKKP